MFLIILCFVNKYVKHFENVIITCVSWNLKEKICLIKTPLKISQSLLDKFVICDYQELWFRLQNTLWMFVEIHIILWERSRPCDSCREYEFYCVYNFSLIFDTFYSSFDKIAGKIIMFLNWKPNRNLIVLFLFFWIFHTV